MLSANYGEYITLQRKNIDQYEIAFSPDPGYLLGESIWYHFKQPVDMIYCEVIPNTTEAILVIVKSGSVYLDGIFPVDSIPEELIVFISQQNNFAIYIYGDVPISETPQEGKFSFDSSLVKSFTILDSPVFPTLRLIKAFQLQLVDPVLKAHGIGVFPVKPILGVMVMLGLLWMGWTYVTTRQKILPPVPIGAVNPYQLYLDTLNSPDPSLEMQQFFEKIKLLYTIPGWWPESIEYANGSLRAAVKSKGVRTNVLFDWAKTNNATVEVLPDGFFLQMNMMPIKRPPPTTINRLKNILADLVDRLSYILPGNSLKIATFADRRTFTEAALTVNFSSINPETVALVGEQFKGLPLVLSKVSIKMTGGSVTGVISLKALGN